MDLWTVVAVVMLVVWAGVTFGMAPAPGWVHALLTAGVFLLIYRAVVRGTPGATRAGDPARGDG
jgi:threonine/homoserine/homoserine lactone efflux protein